MSSPVRLYLARHGRTEWNQARRFQGGTDVPLDDVGREQARVLANLLRGKVQAVLASDLCRASESASIIAGVLQLPVLGFDPDFRERGYGVFEGLTREDCLERYPVEWAARQGNPNFLAPGAELPTVVIERMQRGLERAVALARGTYESVLIVGHGSATRMFIEGLSGQREQPLGNMEFREVLHAGDRFALV